MALYRKAAERKGLKLVATGVKPHPVQSLLTARMRSLLHRQETRYKMIAEGIRFIQHGDNPAFIGEILCGFYET